MVVYSVIFVGTGAFGVPILHALSTDKRFQILSVITGPDERAGRKLEVVESPVKTEAQKLGIPVHQPSKIADFLEPLKEAAPDFLLVVAYGQIMPKSILEVAKIASINVHGSLLPKYRGASPIHAAILNGDRETGVSWPIMTSKLDAGPVIAMEKTTIGEDEAFSSLYSRLAELAAKKTGDALTNYAQSHKSTPQNDEFASYATTIQKSDGMVDFLHESAEKIMRKMLAYDVWPGCSFLLNGKRMKVIAAGLSDQVVAAGVAVRGEEGGLLVGTKKGTLSIDELQPESKKAMKSSDFLRGVRGELSLGS